METVMEIFAAIGFLAVVSVAAWVPMWVFRRRPTRPDQADVELARCRAQVAREFPENYRHGETMMVGRLFLATDWTVDP